MKYQEVYPNHLNMVYKITWEWGGEPQNSLWKTLWDKNIPVRKWNTFLWYSLISPLQTNELSQACPYIIILTSWNNKQYIYILGSQLVRSCKDSSTDAKTTIHDASAS